MKCPTCKTDLRQTDYGEYGSVILDICPACEGAWFDKGELDRLDKSVWTDVEHVALQPSAGDDQPRNCPKCGTGLTTLSPPDVPEVAVDRCPTCEGFWLDAGELEKMQDEATRTDEKKLAHMRHYKKPDDWSHLRWAIYCFKTFR